MQTVAQRKLNAVAAGRLTVTHAVLQLRSYLVSLTLGREFGESIDDYLARRPDVAEQRLACLDAIERLTTRHCN
jgi:hypothetical protein